MSEAPVIEQAKVVEFFNVKDPGITILVKQDPETFKPGANPALAQNKYAEFRAGLFSTSDPEIIEILNSPDMRTRGVRCKDNPEDVAEFGSHEDRVSWMEQEITRRVQEKLEEERARAAHAGVMSALGRGPGPESAPPDESDSEDEE